MRYALIPAGAGGHTSRPHIIVSAVRFSIGDTWLVFGMQTCRVTRSVWVRGGLLRYKTLTLRDMLSRLCVGKAVLLFHALTALSVRGVCREQKYGCAFCGGFGVQPGQ